MFVSRLASGFPPTLIFPPPVAALCGLTRLGKLREHQNGVNTFSTFMIFPVVLSHPPSSTVTACLGPAFPRKFTFGGRG